MDGIGNGNVQFAGSVMLGDLNDFIAPSTTCVNPVFAEPAQSSGEKLGVAKISLDSGVFSGAGEKPVQPSVIKPTPVKTAKISLSDCLACSGCVTSAETVLITQQSTAQLESDLKSKSVASVAAETALPLTVAYARLVAVFKAVGFHAVLDVGPGTDLALLEACEEFVARYKARKAAAGAGGKAQPWEAPHATVAISSQRSAIVPDGSVAQAAAIVAGALSKEVDTSGGASDTATATATGGAGGGAGAGAAAAATASATASAITPQPAPAYNVLPMLASACPGWVCFAEKTHPQSLPYISTAKSPQQIVGTLVKHVYAARAGVKPHDVYHATLMPCFDKKLEASRRDFFDEVSRANDVDCVITSAEILRMAQDKGMPLSAPLPSSAASDGSALEASIAAVVSSMEKECRSVSPTTALAAEVALAGSGGYMAHLFRRAAKRLFGVDVKGELEVKRGRRQDFHEVELKVEGKVALRFASAYGFRSIQGIITKLKRGTCRYDYVEVMACPSGCPNGGGQIRPADAAVDEGRSAVAARKERVAAVSELLQAREERDPASNPLCAAVYKDVLGAPFSSKARELLHTQYHAVPQLKDALTMKW